MACVFRELQTERYSPSSFAFRTKCANNPAKWVLSRKAFLFRFKNILISGFLWGNVVQRGKFPVHRRLSHLCNFAFHSGMGLLCVPHLKVHPWQWDSQQCLGRGKKTVTAFDNRHFLYFSLNCCSCFDEVAGCSLGHCSYFSCSSIFVDTPTVVPVKWVGNLISGFFVHRKIPALLAPF